MKAMFFDLCETLVCGLVGLNVFPNSVRRNCGIEWKKHFPDGLIHDELFLDVLRGYIPERAYWEKLIERKGFEIGVIDLEFSMHEALLTVYNGMPGLLRTLRKQGYTLYLVSDISRESMEFVLNNHKFMELFEQRFFSCNMGRLKSDPDTFDYVLRSSGVEPQEAIFIDDDEGNVERATQAGMIGIVYDSKNYKSTEKLKAALRWKGVDV